MARSKNVLLFGLVLLLLSSNSRAWASAAGADRPLLASISGGNLFVVQRGATVTDLLSRQPLRDRLPGVAGRTAIYIPDVPDLGGGMTTRQRDEHRSIAWRVRRGLFWYVQSKNVQSFPHYELYRAPIAMLPFRPEPAPPRPRWDFDFARTDFDPDIERFPVTPTRFGDQGPAYDQGGGFFCVAWNCKPIGSANARTPEGFFFDIVPEGDHECTVFCTVRASNHPRPLVAPAKEDRIYAFTYAFRPVLSTHPNFPDPAPGWVGRWRAESAFPTRFMQPFRVFVRGDAYYFATASGQVYEAKPSIPERDGMRLIWPVNATPSIVAVVEEGDSGKAFAFTSDSFFEIGPDPKPQPCYIGPASDIKPDDPMPTLRRCAQTLVQRGLIKPPAAENGPPGRSKPSR